MTVQYKISSSSPLHSICTVYGKRLSYERVRHDQLRDESHLEVVDQYDYTLQCSNTFRHLPLHLDLKMSSSHTDAVTIL